MTRHVTVELTEAELEVLESEASRTDQSIAQVVATLVHQRVECETRFKAAVEEGFADIARGATFSHDEVMERARRRAALMSADLDSP